MAKSKENIRCIHATGGEWRENYTAQTKYPPEKTLTDIYIRNLKIIIPTRHITHHFPLAHFTFGYSSNRTKQILRRLSRARLLGAVAMLANALKIPFRIAAAKFLWYDMVNIHIALAKFSSTFFACVPAVVVIISVIIFEICITIAHNQIDLTLVLKCHKYPSRILKR